MVRAIIRRFINENIDESLIEIFKEVFKKKFICNLCYGSYVFGEQFPKNRESRVFTNTTVYACTCCTRDIVHIGLCRSSI